MMTPCGRPTKSGTPCKQPGIFESVEDKPCHIHASAEDKKIFAKYQEAWVKGFEEGHKSGRESVFADIARAEREAEIAANTRYIHSSGAKIVQVGGYTYLWHGEGGLTVGDEVELPAGWSGGPWTGKVTALGSDYVGPMKSVISKVGS